MQRDLVERAMAGDHEAFSELARASIGRLYAAARLILRDDHRAEDATQEALVAAYAVTRPRIVAGERRPVPFGNGMSVGAITGLVGGAVFAVAIAFADWFGVDRIREVFVAVTEPLIDFLTFEKGVPAGLPILVGLCVAGGVIELKE